MDLGTVHIKAKRFLILLLTDFILYVLITSVTKFYESEGYYGIGFAAFTAFVGIIREVVIFSFLILLMIFLQITLNLKELIAFSTSFIIVFILGLLINMDYRFGKSIVVLISQTDASKLIIFNFPLIIAFVLALILGSKMLIKRIY